MSWNYNEAQGPTRPSCWGHANIFNADNRECSRCSFQNSCRDEIVKIGQNQSQSRPFFTNPPVINRTTHQPQPAFYNRPTGQTTVQNQIYNPPQVQHTQNQQVIEPYTYGWIPDPLQHGIPSVPVRVQLPGETFGQRVVKNAGLAMAESFIFSMFLAVRQAVLPPKK